MVANPASWSYDFGTYLRFEREAEDRHELIGGEIVAMAGASRRHNELCERLRDAIRPALKSGPCKLRGSDQRLAVLTAQDGWVGYYPDLAVYCSQKTHPKDRETLIAPSLILEVTSKSTEKKDRGVKLESYLQIPSLRECLIVSHLRKEIELWRRNEGEEWTRRLETEEDSPLLRLGGAIDVYALYEDLPPLTDR